MVKIELDKRLLFHSTKSRTPPLFWTIKWLYLQWLYIYYGIVCLTFIDRICLGKAEISPQSCVTRT